MDPNRFHRSYSQHNRSQFGHDDWQQFNSLPSRPGSNSCPTGSYQNPGWSAPQSSWSYNRSNSNLKPLLSINFIDPGAANKQHSGFQGFRQNEQTSPSYRNVNPVFNQQYGIGLASVSQRRSGFSGDGRNNVQAYNRQNTFSSSLFHPNRQINVGNRSGEIYEGNRSGEIYVGNRSGEIYGGSRSGEIYEGNRSGEIYEGNRSGEIYEGNRSGEIYEGNRSGEIYEGNRSGEIYEGNRSGEIYEGNRSGGIYEGNRSGEMYEGYRSGEMYEGNRGGEIYEGNRGGEIYEGNRGGEIYEGNRSGEIYEGNRSGDFDKFSVCNVSRVYSISRPGGYGNRNEKAFVSPRRTCPSKPSSTGSPILVMLGNNGKKEPRCKDTGRSTVKHIRQLAMLVGEETLNREVSNSSKTSSVLEKNSRDLSKFKSDGETVLDPEYDEGMDTSCDVSDGFVSEKAKSETESLCKEPENELFKEVSKSDKIENSDTNTSGEVLMLATLTEHLCLMTEATKDGQTMSGEMSDAKDASSRLTDVKGKNVHNNERGSEINCSNSSYETDANGKKFDTDAQNKVIDCHNTDCSQSALVEDKQKDYKLSNDRSMDTADVVSIGLNEYSIDSNLPGSSQNMTYTRNQSSVMQNDHSKSLNALTKQEAKCHSPFVSILKDEDRQLLREYDIHRVCTVNLGAKCYINTYDMDTTQENNTMENEATTSRMPPARKSPVCFLSYDDTYIESLDEDEDSDDNELLAPAFLQSVEDIMNRPAPTTPTRARDGTPNSSQNFSRDCESPDLIQVKPRSKLTLDGLFQEHEEHADNVKEMDEINEELQNDLKQGGFVQMLNKEEALPAESFTDEQRQMLQQLEVQDTSLQHDWPGVVVFKPENYQCLFNNTVHPTQCEFVAASNGGRLEKYLESLTVDQYKMVLTSQMSAQLFTRITNQNQLLRWLFYMMSVHEDDDIQRGSQELLLDILHTQHVDGQPKWMPRLIDILSVLVNYGASLESLLPCGPSDVDIIRGKLFQQPGYSHQPIVQQAGYQINNLMLVLRVLAQSLYGQCGRYSPNDASLLFYALCKVILDPSTKNCPCSMEVVQNCLTMVIRQYTESDWLKERLRLCRLLPGLSTHHHDHSHVAHLLPSGERGAYIQQRYCYLVVSRILTGKIDISDNELDNFEIGYLEKFVNYIRELHENNPYTLSSVIKLIELSVGVNYTLNATQREQLKSLHEKVSRVRVRESIGMLDRTRVKNMIVMVTSRWALDLQTVRRKQTKIFQYASSPVRMHIETLKQVQSSDDEDEESDNEDVPRKIRKLSNDDTEVNSQNSVLCEVQKENDDVISGESESCKMAGLNDDGHAEDKESESDVESQQALKDENERQTTEQCVANMTTQNSASIT